MPSIRGSLLASAEVFSVPTDTTIRPNVTSPPLSERATELLIEATKDSNGVILCTLTMTGLHVETNGHDLIRERTAREDALWKAAINELEASGLVEDRNHKREVYWVTALGYQVADQLILRRPETERQRKVRKIQEMRGTSITLRWLNTPEDFAQLGRVRGEAEMTVSECDEDIVKLENSSNNAKQSLPLDQIYVGFDDRNKRPALEYKP